MSGGRGRGLGRCSPVVGVPPRGFVCYACCAPRSAARRATWAVKSSYFDDHCPDGDRGGGAFAIMSAFRSYGSYMHRGQRAKFTSADSCIHEFISKVRTRQIKLRPYGVCYMDILHASHNITGTTQLPATICGNCSM